MAPSSTDASKLCLKAVNGADGGELGRKVEEIFKTRLDRGEMHCRHQRLSLLYAIQQSFDVNF